MRFVSHLKKFSDNVFLQDYFKMFSKVYQYILKSAKVIYKDIYYNRKLGKSGNIAKETWSILNDLRNKASSSCTISTSPEKLNNSFVNVNKNFTNKITPSHDQQFFLHAYYFAGQVYLKCALYWNITKNSVKYLY